MTVSTSSTTQGSWRPRLVALDIDGTLIQWVEGTGQDNEEIAPAPVPDDPADDGPVLTPLEKKAPATSAPVDAPKAPPGDAKDAPKPKDGKSAKDGEGDAPAADRDGF